MPTAHRAIADLETLLRTATGRRREEIERILAKLKGSIDDADFVDVRLPPPTRTPVTVR
ncbi:hypothetical protein [Arenibaculum pallidiluteum]|uniref:hypothetical protein n=1 Tax=Arenibaculum pallidiluteum TaxID=2812559 RepID=UPI001A971810|nr:hypothetical protein [Arenibaculum pallidiluteum]